MKPELIAVVGPTASGKTRRAVEIAEAFDGEIISCDSRQVYRNMTIGTGKDLNEYNDVPYHLIDICDAGEKYNLHRFLHEFHVAHSSIQNRGHMTVACGGSGMYIENALSGIRLPEVPEDSEFRKSMQNFSLEELKDILSATKQLHNVTDVDTKARAIRAIEIERYYQRHPEEKIASRRDSVRKLNSIIIGIDIDRENRRKRISQRLDQRLEEGMIEEVRSILDSGVSADDLIYYGLEYKYVTLHVIGQLSYEEMRDLLRTAIFQFAKRQMTWFRGMEKRGFRIHWLPYDMPSDKFISIIRDDMVRHEG